MQNVCKISICGKKFNNLKFTDTYQRCNRKPETEYEKVLPIYWSSLHNLKVSHLLKIDSIIKNFVVIAVKICNYRRNYYFNVFRNKDRLDSGDKALNIINVGQRSYYID